MKKIFKAILSLSLAVFVLFGLTACKTPLSSTTVDHEKTLVNGVTTNGGSTLIHGEYLYFINGTKTNDGSSSRNNVQGSICRVKYDVTEGKVLENAEVEVVVSDLVGFEDGTINIFGDFLYYTTPSADVNYQGSALCHKTQFNRYDLVNGVAHNIYTTNLNDSSETVSYAYYIVGQELYLLVYESVSKTLKSIKICDGSYVVYSISDVESCVFSDNNGLRVDENVVDANDFVFYTKKPTVAVDGYEEGSKVYKVSPTTNNSVWMKNNSVYDNMKHDLVTILCIKNGKLIYSDESKLTGIDTIIYAQTIKTDSELEFNADDIISYNAYNGEKDQLMFDAASNGNVSIIGYNATSNQIVYVEKEDGVNVPHTIVGFDKETDVDFIGTTTVKEIEKDENGEIISSHNVQYLLYTITTDSKVSLYKIEIKRDGNIAVSPSQKTILSSEKGMIATNGLIIPESIGNNLFVISNDDDKNAYMHFVDISKDVDDENNKVTFIGKK